MTIPVFYIGPTAVADWTLKLYMDDALRRHPDVTLIALHWFGAVPVLDSLAHAEKTIERKLLEGGPDLQGRDGLDKPHMVIGHSQGAIVAAIYGLKHRDSCMHVVTLAGPFGGAWLSRVLSILQLGRLRIGAARDLQAGSELLVGLMRDLPAIADRLTNFYSPNEIVMASDACYLDVAGATNILVGTKGQIKAYRKHLPWRLGMGVLETADSVNHLNEMLHPELRSAIWRIVDDVSVAYGFTADGVPDHQLTHKNVILRHGLGQR